MGKKIGTISDIKEFDDHGEKQVRGRVFMGKPQEKYDLWCKLKQLGFLCNQ